MAVVVVVVVVHAMDRQSVRQMIVGQYLALNYHFLELH
jgi:hypothetical protein